MITTKDLYASCGISPEVYDYCEGIAEELKERFEAIDAVADLPILGPRIAAPMRAAIPPTMCICAEPAKSWNPH